MFIAVDGIDGSGKTTLVSRLAALLSPLNPLVTKEPTDRSKWGQRLREATLKGRLPVELELEYFHRDRVWHIDNVIAPALREGRPVLCDRYVDSTLAFQTSTSAEADNLYESFVDEILVPDLTLILDCPVEIGLERIRKRNGGLSQFETVATLSTAKRIYDSREGKNYRHIDASRSADETFLQAVDYIKERAAFLDEGASIGNFSVKQVLAHASSGLAD